jgi:N-acetylmuramoyl-L-alanine amidase
MADSQSNTVDSPNMDASAAASNSDQEQTLHFSGKRVGIQAGHWQTADAPAELASLRSATGASAGGYNEVDLNVKIAKQVAAILEQQGIQVDLLPTTVPVKYQADAFVSLHSDAAGSTAHGFKAARSSRSLIPTKDDALVNSLYSKYGEVTGLPTNGAITTNMTGYYAFYTTKRQYTVAATTPSAIIEMGFLTNTSDRKLMVNQSDTVAQGIAQGIMDFLSKQ